MQCNIKHEYIMKNIPYGLYLGAFLVFVLHRVNSFHIVQCDSNKINTVNWSNITQKAIIKHDENTNISLPYSGPPISIWCESNSAFDECVLSHQGYNTTMEEIRCTYSPTANHIKDNSCQNEQRIIRQPSSGYRCKFDFHKVTKTGMHLSIKLVFIMVTLISYVSFWK